MEAEDIHLDIEALRVATDARASEQAQADRLRHARGLGRAIAVLRERAQLRQEDIPGLSSRQLRRLERCEFVPRMATLEKLAAAHGMSLAGYLDGLKSCASVVEFGTAIQPRL
ncbi:MAG: hypothetical protein FJ125_10240 [Deltaproteobacteria bacterium]|nr:hypothetical protein [Deltaproteobacteria bacterium]